MRGRFREIWKSQLVELRTKHRTRRVDFRGSQRPDEFVCNGHCTRWGTDGKVIIERLCISLPYVETSNSKVIKGFVPELRSRYMYFVFRDSYVLCIYVMKILCTFHKAIWWLCNSETIKPIAKADKWVDTFPKGVSPKINAKEWLKFEQFLDSYIFILLWPRLIWCFSWKFCLLYWNSWLLVWNHYFEYSLYSCNTVFIGVTFFFNIQIMLKLSRTFLYTKQRTMINEEKPYFHALNKTYINLYL